MDDSIILRFDPLSSPERPALNVPSIPRDKENVTPDKLSMSAYFNRPYGVFSNTSPHKQPASRKAALIELSSVLDDDDDVEEEDITQQFILDGLRRRGHQPVSMDDQLVRRPMRDMGQANGRAGVQGVKVDALRQWMKVSPAVHAAIATPTRTPSPDCIRTPSTAVRLTRPTLDFTPETPPTVRPSRILRPAVSQPGVSSSQVAMPTVITPSLLGLVEDEDEPTIQFALPSSASSTAQAEVFHATSDSPVSPPGVSTEASPSTPMQHATSLPLNQPGHADVEGGGSGLDRIAVISSNVRPEPADSGRLSLNLSELNLDELSFDLIRGLISLPETSFFTGEADSDIFLPGK